MSSISLRGLTVLALAVGAAIPAHAVDTSRALDRDQVVPRDVSETGRLTSEGTGPLGLSRAGQDVFWLYGAPGSLEGTFETAGGAPDHQGWVGVDKSDLPNHWNVNTFNAETLGGHGAGNHAVWAGTDEPASTIGWVKTPGYGNSWNDLLVWRSPPLVDTSIAQTVELDFFFHHDSEPGYDFFTVQYDSAGFAPRPGGYYTGGGASGFLVSVSGTDADGGVFSAPGLRFADVKVNDILYAGNDYGGDDGDQIVILLQFTSDGGYSDEDGSFLSTAGAVQVDDIVVRWDDGTGVIQESFEDFEGVDPLINGDWSRVKAPFAGDFADVLPNVSDIDPCFDNTTPVVTFIDYGQTIGNAASALELPGTPTSTGGTTSAYWNYGVAGGFVLNFTGGVSKDPESSLDGPAILFNEFWSPPIAFDLPGTDDDAADVAGIRFQFDEYTHMPLTDGMFWVWGVRAQLGDGSWTDWRDDNFVFYGGPIWRQRIHRLEELFPEPDIEYLQIALGVWDLSGTFGFPGADATPGFFFDNVKLAKVRVPGPRISARRVDLPMAGFPQSGDIDASTQAARDLLDVRFDMAQDINNTWVSDASPIPGDSTVVEVVALIPGTTVADLALSWVLDRNPLFDDVRSAPSRPQDRNVDTTSDPGRWTGETIGQVSTIGSTVIEDRYFFDLPDQDFLYPGDVLRFYYEATDSDGRTSTLPADLSGFGDGDGWPETFTVRALPSLTDAAGEHPPVLVVDYAADETARGQLTLMLQQIGWTRGVHYDYFRRSRTSFLVGDGIGGAGAHGATTVQVLGYETLLLDHSRAASGLSSGTDSGQNDRSNDAGLLRAFLESPGDRSILHIGVDQGGGLFTNSENFLYLREVLGADPGGDFGDPPVSNLEVVPTAVLAGPRFEVFTGCFVNDPPEVGLDWLPGISAASLAPGGARKDYNAQFDTFGGESVVGHVFEDGGVFYGNASIVWSRTDGLDDRKFTALLTVRPSDGLGTAPHPDGALPTTALVKDLLVAANSGLVFGTPTDAPSLLTASFAAAPNPFNPRTTIDLVVPQTQRTTVRVYDVRGRQVRTLHDGLLEAGRSHTIVWDGRDDAGQGLASGVYLIQAVSGAWSGREKVTLLK